MITLNKNISKGLVNGQIAIVILISAMTLVLQLPNGAQCSLPLTRNRRGRQLREAFSAAGGYAMTIHKSQGLTLKSVCIYWDSRRCQPGLGYTALSRVRCFADISFVGIPTTKHFQPVDL
jgi:ATP-dependent exoDNAse (exonuclease V) alpha subunit